MLIEFGVSRQIVSRWENGDAIPRATKVKIICDEFNISPEILFKKDNSDKEISDLRTNEISKKRWIKRCIVIIFAITLLIYLIYLSFKFVVINKINKNIREYEKWTNYYAKIEIFEDARQTSKVEIWYKDNNYKIKSEEYNEDLVENESIRIVRCKEKSRIELVDGELVEYQDDYLADVFDNGKYILEFCPWIYDFQKNKLKICFSSNVSVRKERKCIKIKNGKKIVCFDSDMIKPINYSNSENDKIAFTSYEITLNGVKDEDLRIENN